MLSSRECAFSIGETFTSRFTFDPEGIRRFAVLSGDMNPLHHDEPYARGARFGSLIACADQPTSYMKGALATVLTSRGDALALESGFKLAKAVLAGDELALDWSITEVIPEPKREADILILAAELRNAAGVTIISAWCKTIVFSNGSGALLARASD